jgi:hypothetical protein
MSEGMKIGRDLPGYSWSKDSRSIVITQGGKLRRLDVASGRVTTIPFTARVHRTISEMAYSPLAIPDGPMTVKFPRWTSASPDGRRLAVQAVGRVLVMDLPSGTPRRLTPESFEPLEMSPAWSPDGRWIAFTSWADFDLGHVFKIPSTGGQPQQLTTEAGEYLNTVWRPDGEEIIVTRGSGATLRGRSASNNLWYELVRVPSGGGDTTPIVTVNRPYNGGRPLMPRRPIVQASFGPEGRLFYPETSGPTKDEKEEFTEFVSIRLDGTDRRTHLIFPFADEASISPDGRWLAFQEGDNTYLLPFPLMGTGTTPTRIDKRKGRLPVTPISTQGGNFPRWRNAATLEFVSGPQYSAYNVETKSAETAAIKLTVPRPTPAGAIALTGARLITLDHRKVIDHGTIVVKAGRVSCVGTCSTAALTGSWTSRARQSFPLHRHARPSSSRSRRRAPSPQLGIGDLPGVRRHNDARRVDVVGECLSNRRDDRSRRHGGTADVQLGGSVVLGRRGATERDRQLQDRRRQHRTPRFLRRGDDEAVHAAEARPTPVDLGHRAQAQAARHGRGGRSGIQPQHDHGRPDRMGTSDVIRAALRRCRDFLRHGSRLLLADVHRRRRIRVERGILLPGERRLEG